MEWVTTSDRLRHLGGAVFIAIAVLALLPPVGAPAVWIAAPSALVAFGLFAVADALDGEHRDAMAMGTVVLGFVVAIVANTRDWQVFKWAGFTAVLTGAAYLFARSIGSDTTEPTAGP